MAMAHELPSREHGRDEFRSIDDCVEPALQEPDQLLRRVALKPGRLAIDRFELLLGDVAVIALQLLLGAELLAIVGEFAAASLTVLARTVFALVIRALGTAPDILAEPPVDLVLGVNAFGHAFTTPKSNKALRGLHPAPCDNPLLVMAVAHRADLRRSIQSAPRFRPRPVTRE